MGVNRLKFYFDYHITLAHFVTYNLILNIFIGTLEWWMSRSVLIWSNGFKDSEFFVIKEHHICHLSFYIALSQRFLSLKLSLPAEFHILYSHLLPTNNSTDTTALFSSLFVFHSTYLKTILPSNSLCSISWWMNILA